MEGAHGARLEKFDGTDASAYKRWRRRATLMLISLPNTYPAEKLGPKLMEFLSGEAELAVEHVTVEEMAKEGGERKIFRALDERFKPLEKDDMNEALREYFFDCGIRNGEAMKAFTTRLSTVHRKLGEHGVTLPKEVQGWFLLRKLKVDASQEAMILTATQGSYQIDKIEKSIRAVLPNAKGVARVQKDTFTVEESISSTGESADSEDDAEILQVLVADMQKDEEYDEENMLDTFETYKQVRNRIMENKKVRGYRNTTTNRMPWKLTGSISAKLDQVRARTRCFRCNQIGHWKKECPSRGKPSSSSSSMTGGASTGKNSVSKEVHIIEEGDMDDQGEAYAAMLETVDLSVQDEFDDFKVHYTDVAERSDVTLDSFHAEVVGHVEEEEEKALSRDFHQVLLDRSDCQDDSDIGLTEVCEARGFEVMSAENSEVKEVYMSAALDKHGVPDAACRRSLIGEKVLEKLERNLNEQGIRVLRKPVRNIFKFGNSETLISTEVAVFECNIGHRRVVCQVAVLPGSGGSTPFLMSKEMLKGLGAVLDTTQDTMHFKHLGVTVQLGITSRGHYAVPLFENETRYERTTHTPHMRKEVMMNESSFESQEEGRDCPDRVLLHDCNDACHDRRQPAVASKFGATRDDTIPSRKAHGSVIGCATGFASSSGNSRQLQHDRGQVQEQPHHEHEGDLHPGQGLCQVGARAYRWPFSNESDHAQGIHSGQRSVQEREAGNAATSAIDAGTFHTSMEEHGRSRSRRGHDDTDKSELGSDSLHLTTVQSVVYGTIDKDDNSGSQCSSSSPPEERDDDMDTSAPPVPAHVLESWGVMTQELMALQEVKRRAMETNIQESMEMARVSGQRAVVPKLVSRVFHSNTDRAMEHF